MKNDHKCKNGKCIETIACQDGELLNLPYHQQRLNKALIEVYKTKKSYELEEIIIPNKYKKGYYKCRVVYNHHHYNIAFLDYKKRKIHNIALVHANNINYRHKYEDRDEINRLLASTKEHLKQVDEVLFIKNNVVTDMSIANIALKRKNDWYTPKTPLLRGTYRQYLIDNKAVIPAEIVVNSSSTNYDFLLSDFEEIKPINALLRWREKAIPLTRIVNLDKF